MTPPNRPLLGITMGDPGGVGPEVCVKALGEPEVYEICRPLIIGDAGPLRDALGFSNLRLNIRSHQKPDSARFQFGTIDVLDLENLPIDELRYGEVAAAQGKAGFEYIARAIELAMAGAIDGTVTGPINKAAINAAGFHYAGHTEIYGTLTNTRDYAMMLTEGDFRVSHVSTHVSLREACDRVKTARVLRVVELTNDALRQMGLDRPRIAVAGLNPHCGEGGLFGDEDDREIAPAVKVAQDAGITAEGPLPADTVFCKMKGGMFDAVVVMYHDQGHIPTKLTGFQYDHETGGWLQMAGVNITLGLPIIRTSVDHGTAFDIAGRGRATSQSMIQAIRAAAQMAGRKGGAQR
jgi:4-hydroxythreonine-4-phosphate dehydrogenase